jgi:hypothetical protein
MVFLTIQVEEVAVAAAQLINQILVVQEALAAVIILGAMDHLEVMVLQMVDLAVPAVV